MTSYRDTPRTATSKRATVCFDPGIHRALRVKAADTERLTLAEDAEALAAFDARACEPGVAFADALKGLKRRVKQ